MKILVVEDDLDQIEYAKGSLGDHDLTIFQTAKEFFDDREIFDIYDIILTDLFLPEKNGSESRSECGFRIIRRLVSTYFQNGHKHPHLKGVGLVSDFEHHTSDLTGQELKYLNIFKIFSISLEYYSRKLEIRRKMHNYICFADLVVWWAFKFKELKSGKLLEYSNENSDFLFDGIRSGEIKMIKPWKEIVEILVRHS